MTKRTSTTRATKIASGEPKKSVRRQGGGKATENPEAEPKPTLTEASVTSMVARAGRPKLIASYATLVAHRAPIVSRVKTGLGAIQDSYDKDGKAGHHDRSELAHEVLDELIELFDHNGFSNNGDRLVFAWLMFDCLKPIGHRTDEVCDLVEKTFGLRAQALSEHGLGLEISRRRERQQKRREEQKKAA
jgi:hypothetical protein